MYSLDFFDVDNQEWRTVETANVDVESLERLLSEAQRRANAPDYGHNYRVTKSEEKTLIEVKGLKQDTIASHDEWYAVSSCGKECHKSVMSKDRKTCIAPGLKGDDADRIVLDHNRQTA